MLGPTTISNMTLESLLRFIGLPVIKFSLSDHPPFMSTNQPQLCWEWGVF